MLDKYTPPHTCSISSSMSMAGFNKRLIDLETKATEHGEKIEELQDTTKRIEN